MPQTDGSHFAYRAESRDLDFIWDGKSPVIEVWHDGAVIDEIKVQSRVTVNNASSLRWMDWFTLVCTNYVRLSHQEAPA